MDQSIIMTFRMCVCVECQQHGDNILIGDYVCRAPDDDIDACLDAYNDVDYGGY